MVPKLRFKEFCGEWEEKRLGEIVKFLDGKRKPLEKGERISGIYPYYGASGIIDYVKDYIFDEELILLSEDGANIIDRNYRVSFLARGKYWVNNHAHVLKAKENNYNAFICEALERLNYQKYNTGTAQPKLNQDVCKKIILYTPSLPEQTKIADFLSTVDEKIQNQKDKITHLENIKKGFMQKIFARKIRFKDDRGEEFPEWEEKKLGDISHTITKGTTPKQFIETKEINFIKIESIDDVNILNSRCLNISKDVHYGDLKRSILEENDILFSIAGSLGRCCIVKKENLPANTNQALAIIRIRKDIDHRFILNILQSSIMKNYIYKNITVGAQPNLSLEQVANFKFLLPCLKEQ